MKGKINNRKITRHKVPNLTKPGMKFDQYSNQNATFFSKVQNTFKLLEDSLEMKSKQKKEIGETFYFQKKSGLSERLNSLSKPRPQSQNNSQIKIKVLSPKRKRNIRQQIKIKLPELKSSSDFTRKQINGSKLAPMPLENILKQRQRIMQKKTQQCFVQTISQPDTQRQKQNDVQEENFRSDNKDPSAWAQLIINGQGRVYDYFDKQIMEKTKLYIRKQYKINHQSMWK